jgi:hypothetical protein
MMSKRILPATVLLALLAGCAASGGRPSESSSATGSPAGSEPPAASEPPASDPASLAPPSAPDGLPDQAWAAIVADLQARLGDAAAAVTVVSAEQVTWPDGSLGCPKPGQMYTQALVDGYQVVVEVDGTRYDYRVGSGSDVRLCEGNGALEGDY